MSDHINFATMTMDEYKSMKEFDITYGIVPTKFGQCLIGTHEDQICYMSLFDEGKDNSAIDLLQQDWPNAKLREDNKTVISLADSIFNPEEHEITSEPDQDEENHDNGQTKSARKKHKLNVLLRGTEMQCKVWKELTKLKEGTTSNYEQIAKAVGNPRAIRAVATAISKNKIAYVIPCHRVVRKTGALSKYRWGPERKQKILKCEGVADMEQ